MRTQAGLVTMLCERWEEARRQGVGLTPEELCKDHPEVLDEVRAALRHLSAADRVVGQTSQSSAAPTAGGPATPPPDPVLPHGCRYRLVRFLAEGGLGRVYVGHDSELNREVAIKFVLPTRLSAEDAVRRFAWEAEVTGRLEHPGVAPVYGLIRDPETGTVAYAMRLLPGRTLQDAGAELHAGGRPDPRGREFRDLLAHFARVCRTVGFAHTRGFLHRDLKPSNVMVGPAGQTWVLDWGLAKAVGSAIASATLPPAVGTRAGQLLGTPAYMAPEQAAGEIDRLGPGSDVYALGGVLYFLITGRPPHDAPSTAAVLTRALNADVRPARELNPAAPAELAAVCRRALSLRPEDRYPSPEAVAEEVERYLATAEAGPARPRPRRVWAAAGLAAGLLAVAAGVLVVKVRAPSGNETTVEAPDGSHGTVHAKGEGTAATPKDLVTPAGPVAPPAADGAADRKAAEALKPHAKQLGIQLGNGQVRSITPDDPLPVEPFTLTAFAARESGPLPADLASRVLLPALAELREFKGLLDEFLRVTVTDEDLERLAGFPCRDTLTLLHCGFGLSPRSFEILTRFPRLQWVGGRAADADDQLLARLHELPSLQILYLADLNRTGRVTDAGFAALAGLRVSSFGLGSPAGVDRAAYGHIARMPNLKVLTLHRYCPDPAGLGELGRSPGLATLNLHDAGITADQLRAVGGMIRVTALNLNNSRFDEAGLEGLAGLPGLRSLSLFRTGVTDAGLDRLKSLAPLRALDLRETGVTPAGVEGLAAALPNCAILWDKGTVRPRTVPALAGENPPPRDAFPGEVRVYETFDDGQKTDLIVGTANGVRYAVEGGAYVADNPGPGVAQFQLTRVGPRARDGAFVVRVRGTNCQPFISFRGRNAPTRMTWMRVEVHPTGFWRLVWAALQQTAGQWQAAPDKSLAQSTAPDIDLGAGKWVTVAGRTSGSTYDVWVNGRLVASGTVDELGEDPQGAPETVLAIGAIQVATGPARLEVDHVAVWQSPDSPR
jgi:serine/threonine protein kinase